MKTISTFVSLFVIVSICATSAFLYLRQSYDMSAVLTIVWVVSLTIWIKANMVMENKKAKAVAH